MATKLYIGNLSFDTTESDLRETFAAFGDVASCNVITDRDTGRPRGGGGGYGGGGFGGGRRNRY